MQNQIDNNEIYNENEKERAFLISVDTGDFDALKKGMPPLPQHLWVKAHYMNLHAFVKI